MTDEERIAKLQKLEARWSLGGKAKHPNKGFGTPENLAKVLESRKLRRAEKRMRESQEST